VSKQHLTRRSRQSGAVLIVSLLLLLVMTILGIVMMQTTRMQERMAGANRDLNMALQGAEAGLRYGESIIDGYATQPVTVGSLPCTVCQPGTLPVAIARFAWNEANGTDGTSSYAPASQAPPCGREVPRWSVDSVQFAAGIAFSAGLVESSEMVCVGPPLFCNPFGS